MVLFRQEHYHRLCFKKILPVAISATAGVGSGAQASTEAAATTPKNLVKPAPTLDDGCCGGSAASDTQTFCGLALPTKGLKPLVVVATTRASNRMAEEEIFIIIMVIGSYCEIL